MSVERRSFEAVLVVSEVLAAKCHKAVTAEDGIVGGAPNRVALPAGISLYRCCLSPTAVAEELSGQPNERWAHERSVSAELRFVAEHSSGRIRITWRAGEVLACLLAHFDSKRISAALGVDVSTIKSHVHHLLGKFGVRNRRDLVAALLDGRTP